jgi:DNA repair exonuclease SbcCD ATPase subunit
MSAIHEAARTVEQAAQTEEAKLTAILDEAEDIQHQINATEERLRNLRSRLATVTEDLTAQRLANEQAGKLAEVVRHLEIKAAPAPLDVPTPEYERALASHAAAPDRTQAFPAIQQGTDGSPLLTTVLPPHGVEVPREDA